MKQWIRWSGLTAFVVVAALLAVFFLFAAGPLMKWGIEYFGSRAAGAKVDAENVSLSFSPLGVRVDNFTVADAEKPMQNLLEFERADAQLAVGPLLLGKAIIEDLRVDGLKFSTARSVDGTLEQDATEPVTEDNTENDKSQDSLLSGVELPTAEEILAREQLHTETAGKAFREAYTKHRSSVESTMESIPDGSALSRYENEIKALTSGRFESIEDFKARKAKLDELKKQFRNDKQAIAEARKAISVARSELALRLKELKAAPARDMDSIRSKYQLTAEGAANLSALLFGSEAGEWAEQALYWYDKAKPYLDSGEEASEDVAYVREGSFIHFPTDNPWPDFLLRNAQLSASTVRGDLMIFVENVTHQPDVLGKPAHVVVNGAGLEDIEDLTLDAVLDHRKKPGTDTLTLSVKDWTVRSMKLGVAGAELQKAVAQVQGLAVVTEGNVNAQADMQFSQTEFSTQGKTTLARELGSALKGIRKFDVRAGARGKLTSPALELGSDLDRQISAAFSQRMKARQNELEQKLSLAINQRLNEYLGGSAQDLQRLNEMDGSLSDKLDQLSSLGETKLEDYQAQKEREAKEKADRKEAELKAKRDAEKAELERKKKEAADKAREKLKNLF